MGVWLFKGVNDAEKRLWIDAGILFERPVRLVGGGDVPKADDADGGTIWDAMGDDAGLRSELYELERIDDPLKAMGEVAKPSEVDMDRFRGIEMDSGDFSVDDAAGGLSDPRMEDVDFECWWDMVIGIADGSMR